MVDQGTCSAKIQVTVESPAIVSVLPANVAGALAAQFIVTAGMTPGEAQLKVSIQGVGKDEDNHPCTEISMVFIPVRVLAVDNGEAANLAEATRRLTTLERMAARALSGELRDIVGDLRADCKSILDDLKDGQLDAEQAAAELFGSVADLVSDAYIETEEAARSVARQAAEDPVTRAALEARDGCSEENGECGDPALMQFTDNTVAGGCGDWDKFGKRLGGTLARTLARIAREIKRWSTELESVSRDIAEEDSEQPVVDADPQIPEPPPRAFSPPSATAAEAPPKATALGAATARASRTQRILPGDGSDFITTHSIVVAGVHDPANGSLTILVRGPALDGTDFERSATISSFPDCKFQLTFLDIPKGDYTVTIRPENPNPVVSVSSFVSVR